MKEFEQEKHRIPDDTHSIFKYRPMNDYTFELLEDQVFYFASAIDMNDPLECLVNVSYNGTEQEIYDWLKSIQIPLSEEEIRKIAKSKAGMEFAPPETVSNQETNRISCFSFEPDNNVLWAHYANYYSGICIEFNIETIDGSKFISIPDNQLNINHPLLKKVLPVFKVNYQDAQPETWNRIQDNVSYVSTFFVNKQKSWAYEKEVRLLLLDKYLLANKKVRFYPTTIKSKIFGSKIKKKDAAKIKDILQRKYRAIGHNIDLYKISYTSKSYSLSLEPIENWGEFKASLKQ